MKRLTLVRAVTSFAVLLAVLSCQNPFDVGLGDNVDIDRPVVSLSTPSTGSFLRGTVELRGIAQDDVRVASVQLSFNNGANWKDVDSYNPDTEIWRFSLDTTSLPNGSLTVLLRVTDGSGKTTVSNPLIYTIDNEGPRVFFTFPAIDPDTYDENSPPTVGRNGAIFGTVSVREGIAVDSPSIRLWRPGDSEPEGWTPMRSGSETPSVFDFRHNLPAGQVGDFLLRVRAEDVGGQITESNAFRITVISGAPQIAITAPQQAGYEQREVTLSGTMSHETGSQPALRLNLYERDNPEPLFSATSEDSDFEIESDGSGGFTWSITLDTRELPDGTRLPNDTIIAEAFADIADTTGFDRRVFQVDNELPTITITTPAEGETIYSQTTLRGTANDNSSLDSVAVRFGTSGAFQVLDGNPYSWQLTFDSAIYGSGEYAEEVAPDVWRLPITVRAVDLAGNSFEVVREVFVDQDLDKPTVEILSPAPDSNLAGGVVITGSARDDDPGVQRVEMQLIAIRDDGTEIGHVNLAGNSSSADDWFAVYDSDTDTGTAGTPVNASWTQEINANGRLYRVTDAGMAYPDETGHEGRIRIRVRSVDGNDTIGNPVTQTIRLDDSIPAIQNLRINGRDPATDPDAVYVRGEYTITAEATDDEQLVSVQISFDGGSTFSSLYSVADGDTPTDFFNVEVSVDTETLDPPITSGFQEVRLRVRDNANYQNVRSVSLRVDNEVPEGSYLGPDEGAAFDPMNLFNNGSSGSGWPEVRGTARNPGTFSSDIVQIDVFLERGGVPVKEIEINRQHIGAVDNKAIVAVGDGFEWWARFDSSTIGDGVIDIRYVVQDRAGNTFEDTEPGFIRNNPPVIESVTVGTDLNFSGDVTLDEQFPYSSRFNARGRIYISPTITGGNGTPTWELFDSSDLTTPLVVESNLLDISNSTSFPDDDYSFVLRVTDEVGNIAETDIEVRVLQEDSVPPTVEIFELTQAIAEDVAAEIPVVGHIDFLTASDPYTAGLPKVSGVIPVRGRVTDNIRIQNIELDVPGLSELLLARWNTDTGGLVTEDPAFTIDSQILNESDGHIIEWTYLWDTETHPDIAALNVGFHIRAEDFYNAPTEQTRLFDIVPYITDIRGELENGTRRFIRRSALGSYPVRRGEAIEILGFNIGGGTGATVSLPGSLTEISEGRMLLTVGSEADSGYLSVTNSGVESINNLNQNGLTQNREPDQFRPHLTDDRYLSVWGNTSSGLSGRTDVVLGPNSSGDGFDWMNVQNSQSVRMNDLVLSSSWNLRGGSFDRNIDGTLMYVFLHDMNWQSGSDGYQFHGSVQFGIGGGNQGGAFNWQRPGTNRLGLGNLSFVNDPNWSGLDQKVMNRYRNLQIQVDGTDAETNVFTMYFDASAESRGLVFWSFVVGENLAESDRITTMAGDWRTNLTKQAERTENYTVPGGSNVGLRTPQSRVDITDDGQDSDDFAFVYFEGTVYLVYYDESTGEFLFRWNSDPVNNPAGGWSTPRVLDQGAGLYPAIAVDPAGGIHVAYHDTSQSNLRYVYLSDTAAASQPVVVDSLFSNGMNNSLTVREFSTGDYRPVISHFSLAYSGTRFPLRLSYPVAAVTEPNAGAEVSTGNYTGAWETITVLAGVTPADEKTFTFADATGNVVVGYNGSTAEYSTLFGFRE